MRPLTTVEMSQAELARLAFHALLADLQREKPIPKDSEYSLKTRLILRESTARVPEQARSERRVAKSR